MKNQFGMVEGFNVKLDTMKRQNYCSSNGIPFDANYFAEFFADFFSNSNQGNGMGMPREFQNDSSDSQRMSASDQVFTIQSGLQPSAPSLMEINEKDMPPTYDEAMNI